MNEILLSVKNIFLPSSVKGSDPDNSDTTHVVGLAPWRSYVPGWFPNKNLTFYKKSLSAEARRDLLEKLRQKPGDELMVWGYKIHPEMLEAARAQGTTVQFVEDGFVRSVKLGGSMTPPLSIVADSKAPYFDARFPTDLEALLNTFDFADQPDLVARARAAMDVMLAGGISKYNPDAEDEPDFDSLAEGRKKILVLGQVEDDASIQFGCARSLTNNDLVRLASEENPDALIIYKPHPDVLFGYRKEQSNPEEVKDIATILRDPVRLSIILDSVDHVYTITSLAGFEALMRGLPVTCLGAPFYSGWGLTDDRQPTGRRHRTLSIEQLFAIAYIVYPVYFDPVGRKAIAFEDALELIKGQIEQDRTMRQASIKG